MSTSIPQTLNQGTWPNCLIIPSKTGATTNCLNIPMPSPGTILFMLIIAWIIYMAVAYAIYYFLNKQNPNRYYSYWMLLLILVVAGVIISLIGSLLGKK